MARVSFVCSQNRQWRPKPIAWYEGRLARIVQPSPTVNNTYKIKKNIAYNMQYLEYLDQTLVQMYLTSVLKTQTWKSYIVTTASIIETIFYYLVKKNEQSLQPEWVEIETNFTNPVVREEYQTRLKVIREQKKLVEIKLDIKFNQLSRKVEDNRLLGETSVYSKVKKLIKLRNRIHLFSSEDPLQMDTDYNLFQVEDYHLAKKVLAKILLQIEALSENDLVEIGMG